MHACNMDKTSVKDMFFDKATEEGLNFEKHEDVVAALIASYRYMFWNIKHDPDGHQDSKKINEQLGKLLRIYKENGEPLTEEDLEKREDMVTYHKKEG